MNKHIRRLAVGALSAGLLFTSVCSAAVLGDMDSDGGVSSADARTILRAAVGLDTLNETQRAAADMDTDGLITAADARLALRTAVSLQLRREGVFADQYAVLQSGEYCAEVSMGGKDGVPLTYARKGNTAYIRFSMEGIELSLLTDGERLLILDEKERMYADFAEVLELMGDELTGNDMLPLGDLLNLEEALFGDSLRPLSEADDAQQTVIDGVSYTDYVFLNGTGAMRVRMQGARLSEIITLDARGRIESDTFFSSVSAVLPAGPFTAAETYTETDDPLLILLPLFSGLMEE